LVGAAFALGIPIILLNVVLLWDVYQLLGLWPYDSRYAKLLISLLISASVVFSVSSIWPKPSFIQLAAITLLSIVVFGCVLLALHLENYEKAILSTAFKRLQTKR